MTRHTADRELPAATRIGRVTLRVRSADAAREFYARALGLIDESGGDTVALHAGDASTPLVVLEDAPTAGPRAPVEAGLFHLALRVPDRAALGATVRRLRNSSERLDGASDHLVSEAIYLTDPEDNGIEVYADRPREEWEQTEDDGVRMATLPLDVDDLAEQAGPGSVDSLPPGTDAGHVHLETADLDAAVAFYHDALGFPVQARMADAAFLGAGGYHHHVGLNAWRGRTEPRRDDTAGIVSYELVVPGGAVDGIAARLRERDHPVETDVERPGRGADGIETVDPDGVTVRVRGTDDADGET